MEFEVETRSGDLYEITDVNRFTTGDSGVLTFWDEDDEIIGVFAPGQWIFFAQIFTTPVF